MKKVKIFLSYTNTDMIHGRGRFEFDVFTSLTGFPFLDQCLSGRGIPSNNMQGILSD